MARPFSDAERSLLLFLAARGEDAVVLRAQIELAQYDKPWFEGSQSFDIRVADGAPLYWSGRDIGGGRQIGPGCSVRVDGSLPYSDSNYIGEAFLWITEGRVSALEYYWVTEEMPTDLPRLEQLGE
jgi:hypothetical protein